MQHGGEGGIRTRVPGNPDHLISSQRRYDRFGTSPRKTDRPFYQLPATLLTGDMDNLANLSQTYLYAVAYYTNNRFVIIWLYAGSSTDSVATAKW